MSSLDAELQDLVNQLIVAQISNGFIAWLKSQCRTSVRIQCSEDNDYCPLHDVEKVLTFNFKSLATWSLHPEPSNAGLADPENGGPRLLASTR